MQCLEQLVAQMMRLVGMMQHWISDEQTNLETLPEAVDINSQK
jgi:hypothetical protein